MKTASASAPGRVNLIGEHLDHNGGLCLPIAIDRTTTASVRRDPVGTRTSDHASPGWTAYVDGVLAALGVDELLGVDVTSTVPVGAGLSSSAALTCSVALAVDALLDLGLHREAIAAACIRAENEYVGVPTGGLDQAAVLFSRPGTALLLDFANGERTHVTFDPGVDGLALLVLDTGVSHRLADGGYADRAAECRTVRDLLGLQHLAEVDYEDLARIEDEVLRRRARHVLTEQLRVRSFVAAAGSRDWRTAGDLMTASHLSLRDDFEVSCAELDVAVSGALSAGALGARMTGGGFGGSAIALTAADGAAAVVARVREDFARNGWEAPTTFVVEASAGAGVLV